jgi:hypothetical protein
MLIGAHVSPAGGPANAVARGEERACRAIQFFNQSPRAWRPRVYSEQEVAAYHEAMAGSEVDALLTLWDLHAQYRWRGLELRALAAFGTIGNADTLSLDVGSTVGDRQDGHYYEVAYDVMPHIFPAADTQYLAPFFRYENFDTNASVPSGFTRDRTKDTELYTVGLTYKPIPQVALKLDYRNFELARGEATDRVTVGAGFVF